MNTALSDSPASSLDDNLLLRWSQQVVDEILKRVGEGMKNDSLKPSRSTDLSTPEELHYPPGTTLFDGTIPDWIIKDPNFSAHSHSGELLAFFELPAAMRWGDWENGNNFHRFWRGILFQSRTGRIYRIYYAGLNGFYPKSRADIRYESSGTPMSEDEIARMLQNHENNGWAVVR